MKKLDKFQKKKWIEDGFFIIKNLFSVEQCDIISDLHQKIWTEKPYNIALDHLDYGQRIRASELSNNFELMRFKINDLYLEYQDVLNMGLHENVVSILVDILVDKPVLINSLNLDYGTQQDFHVDSLFMTPPTPYNMVAMWVALEDVSPNAGPLEYFPKSHLITPYKFSNGSTHIIPNEMSEFKDYMSKEIEYYGLEKEQFTPNKGDALFWSSYFFHGGGKVIDKNLTRKSVVFHYFSESSSTYSGQDIKPFNGAFWTQKTPIFHNESDPENFDYIDDFIRVKLENQGMKLENQGMKNELNSKSYKLYKMLFRPLRDLYKKFM